MKTPCPACSLPFFTQRLQSSCHLSFEILVLLNGPSVGRAALGCYGPYGLTTSRPRGYFVFRLWRLLFVLKFTSSLHVLLLIRRKPFLSSFHGNRPSSACGSHPFLSSFLS